MQLVLFLLWFFAATFSLSFFKTMSNEVSCNEKDKQALLSLKRGLTDPFNLLSSWSSQEDCCRWDGVHCDNKTSRVTELHLAYTGIGGEISRSLLELEFLNYLDLSFNDFNCTPIPTFLGSMGNLTHLDLSDANFSGLIPHQLGNLSSLCYLYLGSNFDLYADNLYWMSGLFSIQYIDLSSVDLHKEADWLQIMSKFSSLSELYLSNCKLDSLNPSLGFVNFTSLQVLYLSGNHFNHEIPNWFSNLSTSLLKLYLDDSSLKGEIPPSIFNLEKLEYLSLYPNHLIGKIPESLGQLKHLTYLDLSFNSLNGPIPLSVGNLSHMRTLSLNQNQLNGTIPKSLGLLSNLEELYIENNFLTGTIDEGHFKKLSKLKDLSMSQTQLFFNVNSNWVPPFQLEYVSMSSIKIGPHFPSWLQSQRSLGFLDMSMSGISSKAPSWFWNWASNVEAIDLSDNHIEGDLSNILLNSTVINLRSNHFKGRFPLLSENVKVLNIANNSYSGPISTFLCQKAIRKNKLVVLDASDNLLLGELSHCWRYWQQGSRYRTGTGRTGRYVPYRLHTGIKTLTFRTGLNTSRTGHVLAIPANFGQYRPIPGVLAGTEKSFFYFFIFKFCNF
ncbi:receptor-like protein EIX2 isoform X1 [Quercus suber]|uniref:receptor-like protein EIX2 isoform X1 n=1 Tax=Quercus suber TaxID=58331 RepID=UPI0032DF36F8